MESRSRWIDAKLLKRRSHSLWWLMTTLAVENSRSWTEKPLFNPLIGRIFKCSRWCDCLLPFARIQERRIRYSTKTVCVCVCVVRVFCVRHTHIAMRNFEIRHSQIPLYFCLYWFYSQAYIFDKSWQTNWVSQNFCTSQTHNTQFICGVLMNVVFFLGTDTTYLHFALS